MHVPLAHQQQQLVLGEVRVDHRERDARGTPCPTRRTTGTPTCPASTGCRSRAKCGQSWLRPLLARLGRRRAGRIAVEPAMHRVVIVLLRPQHPGERLALHVAHVLRQRERRHAAVEVVGLAPARARTSRRIRRRADRGSPRRSGEAQPDLGRLAGADRAAEERRGLRADARRIHGVGDAVHDMAIERVLRVRAPCRASRRGASCWSRSRRRARRPAPRCRAGTPRPRGASP